MGRCSGERGCSDGAEGGIQPRRAGGPRSEWAAAGEVRGGWRTERALGCPAAEGRTWGRVRVGVPGGHPHLCSPSSGRARGGAGMVPPSKEQRRGAGQPPGKLQVKPLQRRWRVLAERNQSVVPVGAWVESAPEQQSPAFVSAPRAPSAGASRTLQCASKTSRAGQSQKWSFSQPEGSREHGS